MKSNHSAEHTNLAGVFIAVCFVANALAAAEPDFSEAQKAADGFIGVIETLSKEIPKVQDADGTVKVLEAWTNANDAILKAMQAFAQKHPDLTKGRTPPPEASKFVATLSQLKTRYAAVPAGVSALLKRFGGEPAVFKAWLKFQRSLERLDQQAARADSSAGQ